MIEQDGASLIFPDLLRLLRSAHAEDGGEIPETCASRTAAACGPRASTRRTPAATSATSTKCQYINGIAAGMVSKSKKIGFIAAKPIPQVLRNINAFTLGAQSVDPKITCHLIVTGDWALPVKEAEATNSLVDGRGGRGHLPRRQPEGGRRDRGAPRHLRVAATTRNQAALAPERLSDRRGMELAHAVQRPRQVGDGGHADERTSSAAALKEGYVKMSAVRQGGAGSRPQEGRRDARRNEEGHLLRLQGTAEGQHRQGRHSRRQPPTRRPSRCSNR